jgi:hypothetical protein
MVSCFVPECAAVVAAPILKLHVHCMCIEVLWIIATMFERVPHVL